MQIHSTSIHDREIQPLVSELREHQIDSSQAATPAHWYCLRSRPKHEHIAAGHLRKMDEVEVFLPRLRFQRVTRQGRSWVTEALFPNYLFARFNWQNSLRRVQAAYGVSEVIHFGARWPVIDNHIIEDLQEAVGTEELRVIAAALEPGDSVEISSGAMQGMEAVVLRVMSGRARVELLLEFLGRQATIEVPADLVIKGGDVRRAIFSCL